VSRPPLKVRLAARMLPSRVARGPFARAARRALLAHTPALAPMTVTQMRAILRGGSPAERALVLRWSPLPVTARDVLGAVDGPALIGAAAILLGELELPPGELSQAIYEQIVLTSAGDPDRARAAFTTIRRAPQRILNPRREQIFARAWLFARQPVDPYEPNPLHTAARTAAAALLAEHPDLRQKALSDLGAAGHGRQLQLVYAAALQSVQDGLADAFVEALAAIGPSERGAITFARDCDRDFSATDPIAETGSERHSLAPMIRGYRPPRAVLGAACFLLAPAAGAGTGLLERGLWQVPRHLPLDTGIIVTVAGILVAIHVFASELAADRLPGPVARVTSMSLALWAGYGSIAALYALAVWHPKGHEAQTRDALAIGVIAALLLSLAGALRQLLSRTDSAVAARVFASEETRRAARSGRQVGRMHRSVIEARAMLSALGWIRPTISAPLSVRGVTVGIARDGYLTLRHRTLNRLDRGSWWHSGARLWLFGTTGSLVHPGDAVARLVPPAEETLTTSTRRLTQRLFKIQSQDTAERTAEALSALVELTVRLAEAGNEAGASRVARATVSVLEAHVRELEGARGPLPVGEAGAPVPASRSTALVIAHALKRAEDPTSKEVLTALIRRMLPHCSQGDAFLPVLVKQLGEFGQSEGGTDIATHLLLDCGRRVVDLRESATLMMWWSATTTLQQDSARPVTVLEMIGHVIQYAALVDERGGERGWQKLSERLECDELAHQRIAILVGASSLAVGNISLALLVALWLAPQTQWATWATHFEERDRLEWEAFADQLYGHLLGPTPEDALQSFVRFGEGVAEHVH
jgi:hypothetical protein